jgi:hypothetical protein
LPKVNNRLLGEKSPNLVTLLVRVARFFSVQHTKTGKIYQMTTEFSKCPSNKPFCRKIDKMGLKNTNIFHCKAFQNLPKIWIFGLKIYHLASLLLVAGNDTYMSVLGVCTDER